MKAFFKDKIIVVTGGSMGIGEAAAAAFYEEGAKVIILDIRAPAAKYYEDNTHFIRCDVSDSA